MLISKQTFRYIAFYVTPYLLMQVSCIQEKSVVPMHYLVNLLLATILSKTNNYGLANHLEGVFLLILTFFPLSVVPTSFA